MDYKSLVFDYKDLKLRIKKYYDRQRDFAKAMGMDYSSLNLRLNNKAEWKVWEMVKACHLLEIPLADMHKFFCVQKVEKITTEV